MTVNITGRSFKLGNETFIPVSYTSDYFEMDWAMQAGGKVPLHMHKHMDEHFTVTKGQVVFVVNGEEITKGEGDVLTVPRMVPHSIKNNTAGPITLRVRYAPNAGVNNMFTAWAVFADEGSGMLGGMLKWWYVQEKLGWPHFSDPADAAGKVVFGIMGGLAMLAGSMLNWKKHLSKFE